MNKSEIVLVTGANGFIGRVVVEKLLASGQRVRCFGIDGKGLPENNSVEICIGDIRDSKAVQSAMNGCDKIIHLAAVLDNNAPDLMQINVRGTKVLVDAAKRLGISKFVYVSTENVLLKKRDSYSESKLKAERIVQTFNNHVILRLAAVYGKGCRGNMARLLQTVKNHRMIPVVGNGKNLMQPVYVDDAAMYIVGATSYGDGTYMVAGRSAVSMNCFIHSAASAIGKKVILVHIPYWLVISLARIYSVSVKNPKVSVLQLSYLKLNRTYDISRTTKYLKHEPVSLEKGLKKTMI